MVLPIPLAVRTWLARLCVRSDIAGTEPRSIFWRPKNFFLQGRTCDSIGGALIDTQQNRFSAAPVLGLEAIPQPQWFALQTKPRYEKKIQSTLCGEGVDTFLPLSRQVHRWSDRRMTVYVPLFPCYVFVRILPTPRVRLLVLRTSGVISFVGLHRQGVAIPEDQIEHLRRLIDHNVSVDPHAFLRVGQRVRIRGGCLEGLEGLLVASDGDRRLVISVEAIEKSLAISVKGYEIEPV
jgi:transcription antitermination factor NusG